MMDSISTQTDSIALYFASEYATEIPRFAEEEGPCGLTKFPYRKEFVEKQVTDAVKDLMEKSPEAIEDLKRKIGEMCFDVLPEILS